MNNLHDITGISIKIPHYKGEIGFQMMAATILGGLLANGSYVGVEDKAVEMTERLLSAIERSKKC